ncbi:MAG: hypothetical protein LBU65_12405 [Planctomycetaceae bacterium]|jgi:hypothetical protein|nr:hypothetical protein [Planctomycetaceae bacterium]
MSNNDLDAPGFPFPYCIKPLTNQSGYAVACPSANTTFRIWSEESGSTVWKHAGAFYPLTSDANYTFSLNTTLVYPRQGDIIDGTYTIFEWVPRVDADFYRVYFWHESFGWVAGYETRYTGMALTSLMQGTWMWAVESYDKNGNFIDTTVDTEFDVY